MQFIDRFVPAALRTAAPEQLIQARIVAVACLVSASAHLVAFVAISLHGPQLVAVANVLSASLSAGLLWAFHRGASIQLATNSLLALLFLFAAGVSGPTGGDASSALHTFTIVPGIAILVLGWRAGAAWLGAVLAFVAGLAMLRAGGFDFPVQLDPEKVAFGRYPGVVALTFGISGVVLLSEWIRRRTLDELEEARRLSEHAERERRQLETAMLESQKLESLGVMAGGVAHDFNNLLTAILGNASLLPGASRERVGELANDIVLAAEQAADLTHQLLVYAGRSRSRMGPVSLSEVVGEVRSLARSAKGTDVDLSFELGGEPDTVVADPGQIRQVVLNLVSNASAAITGGGRVVVRTGSDGDECFLEVEDDGGGMDEPVRSRIFDPFFTTRTDGRGLGLSAVLGIVRSHGGRVVVNSAPGRGTCMRVLLPRVDWAAESPHEPIRLEPSIRASGRVLVVDDVEAVRRIAALTLSQMGFDVIEASDGRAALAAVDAHPDLRLVLLDATMPGLRGDEVWAEIAKRRPDLPVILSTGDAQGFASVDPDTPGTLWLAKPYRAADLEDVAIRALSAETS